MYGPDLEPITMVLHEDELAVPFTDAVRDAKPLPGGFIAVEVFETERDAVGATLEAVNRHAQRSEREHHMALMYHYNAGVMERITEGGVLTQTIPSPLSTAELIDVLEQLAAHPRYRHQLMVAISEDEQIVTMRDGDAKVVRDWNRNGDSA
jgi:hypothetical protein